MRDRNLTTTNFAPESVPGQEFLEKLSVDAGVTLEEQLENPDYMKGYWEDDGTNLTGTRDSFHCTELKGTFDPERAASNYNGEFNYNAETNYIVKNKYIQVSASTVVPNRQGRAAEWWHKHLFSQSKNAIEIAADRHLEEDTDYRFIR